MIDHDPTATAHALRHADEIHRLSECSETLLTATKSCRAVGLVTLADSLDGVIGHIAHIIATRAVVGRVGGRQ